jgi:hypothetical protein
MNLNYKILLFCLFIVGCNSIEKDKNKILIIRKLPFDNTSVPAGYKYQNESNRINIHIDTGLSLGEKPFFESFYTIDTYKDTADGDTISQTDSFICKLIADSIKLRSFSSVVIHFLKETDATKELTNQGRVKDIKYLYNSNELIMYSFDFIGNKQNVERWINNSTLDTSKLKCW